MTQPASAALVDLPERPAEVVGRHGRPPSCHGIPELHRLFAEALELPLHRLPGAVPRAARDRGGACGGQVGGTGEELRLAAGARLATLTRLAAVTPALIGKAVPAAV